MAQTIKLDLLGKQYELLVVIADLMPVTYFSKIALFMPHILGFR
ncbi:MAG: hypothetical protein AB1Z29_24120 [Desulfobacterales bacterium]